MSAALPFRAICTWVSLSKNRKRSILQQSRPSGSFTGRAFAFPEAPQGRQESVPIPPAAAAVELNQLSKSFRVRRARSTGAGARVRDLFSRDTQTVSAVDRLSFSSAPGERVAFIGPNGAGKSTTLKMLAGILRPDAGEARVLGLAPSRDRHELAFRIGTVFGQRSQLWYQLPARDTFDLLGHVYG